MNRTLFSEPVEKYPAPREDALKYPGKRPSTSFVLSNRIVHPIVYNDEEKGSPGSTANGQVNLDSDGNHLTINKFLESRKVALLEERFPVIGYGSNPAPGQLISKFGSETVIPVFQGIVRNCDFVYNLISNMGYAFAEMISENYCDGYIWVTFLDHKQLEKMIESEQNYNLAYSTSDVTLESGEILFGGINNVLYIFAGFRKIWLPSGYDGPIAIAELYSKGRRLKSLNQTETLELVIEQFNLNSIGLSTPYELVARLKQEAQLKEKPGKLKYDLQKLVEDNPNSLPSLAESHTSVEKSTSLITFAENGHKQNHS